MSLFQLSKKNPRSTILPLFAAHRYFSVSGSSVQNSVPKSSNFNVVDYLVASFGFSPEKAVRVSKSIAHLKSPQKPDAVRSFLQQHGLTDADIKAFITLRPAILCANVDKTIAPNLRALSEMGLSTSALTTILLSSPAHLHCSTNLPRIKFWRDFFGGDEASLTRAFKRNTALATHHIGNNIQPKISLLRSHGLSTSDIRRIVLFSRLITNSVSTIEDALKRTKEFGFQPRSGMFLRGFQVVASNSRDLFKKKMELLTGFGWSQDEFLSAVRRAPRLLVQSEKKLKMKMDYLLREARFNASYLATHPQLLELSLEKRLRPRQYVLCQLESKGLSSKPHDQKESTGLSGKRLNLCNAICLTDHKFVERYILPNEKIIPGLYVAYLAACGIQSTLHLKWRTLKVLKMECTTDASTLVSPTIDCIK